MSQAKLKTPPEKPAQKSRRDKELELLSLNPTNLKHNCQVLMVFRTYVAIISGIVMGILGVEGWLGFVPMLVTQFLCAPAMILKGATAPEKYFLSWNNFLLGGVFNSTTLLTFILFWMLSFNICHIF